MTMWRKTVRLVVMLALVLLTAPLAAHAQPATKVYRIGYVRSGAASAAASESTAFTQHLRELGYTEGQNLVIEWRSADGQAERLPALVAELVQLKVDCLVVGGTGATRQTGDEHHPDRHDQCER
jgi:putative ABC transport system substrate-binding protein